MNFHVHSNLSVYANEFPELPLDGLVWYLVCLLPVCQHHIP